MDVSYSSTARSPSSPVDSVLLVPCHEEESASGAYCPSIHATAISPATGIIIRGLVVPRLRDGSLGRDDLVDERCRMWESNAKMVFSLIVYCSTSGTVLAYNL